MTLFYALLIAALPPLLVAAYLTGRRRAEQQLRDAQAQLLEVSESFDDIHARFPKCPTCGGSLYPDFLHLDCKQEAS